MVRKLLFLSGTSLLGKTHPARPIERSCPVQCHRIIPNWNAWPLSHGNNATLHPRFNTRVCSEPEFVA